MKIWDQKHKNPNLKTKRNEDKYVLSIEEKKEEEEEKKRKKWPLLTNHANSTLKYFITHWISKRKQIQIDPNS
jgi:hypothetical protein